MTTPSHSHHTGNPALRALGGLGSAISYLPGASVFSGQHGWVLSATLLLAVAMIIASGLLGRRTPWHQRRTR